MQNVQIHILSCFRIYLFYFYGKFFSQPSSASPSPNAVFVFVFVLLFLPLHNPSELLKLFFLYFSLGADRR